MQCTVWYACSPGSVSVRMLLGLACFATAASTTSASPFKAVASYNTRCVPTAATTTSLPCRRADGLQEPGRQRPRLSPTRVRPLCRLNTCAKTWLEAAAHQEEGWCPSSAYLQPTFTQPATPSTHLHHLQPTFSQALYATPAHTVLARRLVTCLHA